MSRKTLLAVSVAGVVLVTGGAIATAGGNDGVRIHGQFRNGGTAQLELEDRNVAPMICAVDDNPAPDDGDAIQSSILRAATGEVVVELGSGEPWINGGAQGCQTPADTAAAREVFAHPQDYYLQFTVVDNQGTPVQAGPYRTAALQPG